MSEFRFDEQLMSVLKNFCNVNNQFLFQEGNIQKTISPQKHIMAEARLDSVIPRSFAVYELSKLISTLSLFKNPDVEFLDTHLLIKSGSHKVKYYYTDTQFVEKVPDKKLNISTFDAQFPLAANDLASLLKAAAVMRLNVVSVSGDGETIYIKASENNNDGSNDYSIKVGETDKVFDLSVLTENLKMMTLDYEVKITTKGMFYFYNPLVSYYIAAILDAKKK